jgi:hypothetical protein
MSDTKTASRPLPLFTTRPRYDIPIAGDVLVPRRTFAAEIGIADRTAQRMDLPTTYVGNVAYVAKNAALRAMAERVRHRHEPPMTRRRARQRA